METFLYLPIFFIIYLLTINFFLKKFEISLDKVSSKETHKALLRENDYTPLSGAFYFLPIILFLFYNSDINLVVFCSLFCILGFMSDIKVISSYKKRFILQVIFLTILFFIDKNFVVDVRISFINKLIENELIRILICTFFFMVLINGYNLTDGTNFLCSLNFLLVIIFTYLLIYNLNINFLTNELIILSISILIFILFNFFGKNFLGDGAVYGFSFLLGYILLKITLMNNNVSPYFVANLLWYPAFENLFTFLRRYFSKKNNYLPDNDHLHHLIFKFYKSKKFFKKNFLLSSLTGLSINFILFIIYLIGLKYYHYTMIQVILIFSGIFLYLSVYYVLKKKKF